MVFITLKREKRCISSRNGIFACMGVPSETLLFAYGFFLLFCSSFSHVFSVLLRPCVATFFCCTIQGEERFMELSFEHWNSRDYMHMLHQLLSVGEALLEQGHDVCHHLCLEVSQITFQQAYFFSEGETVVSSSAQFSPTLATRFPVQFEQITYGTLFVVHDQNRHPVLPWPVAQTLASLCGCILYTAEQSWVMRQALHTQRHDLPPVTRASFTKQQLTVLHLMYQGYSQEQIAARLHIAKSTLQKHRLAIYHRLGVRDEYEAILAVHLLRLFSRPHETS